MRNFLILSSLFFISSCGGNTQNKNLNAEDLYIKRCAACHGPNGNAGVGGAKDLSVSTIDDNLARTIITYGKGTMPAFKTVLKPEEIESLILHIKKLRR